MSAEHKPGLDTEAAADTVLRLAGELARELHPRRPQRAGLDSALDRDLGLDSLARVELLARIEDAFGITLPEAVFLSAETPRDLVRAVLAAAGTQARALPPTAIAPAQPEEAALPEGARTLVEVLLWHASRHPERPHIRFYADGEGAEAMTYGELLEGAETVAASLQRHGVQPGEAVAIMVPTGRDYFLCFYGALLAGAIPVPLYPPARLTQIEDHLRRQGNILRNCLAATLITLPQAKPLALLLRSSVESLRGVVTPEELQAAKGRPEVVPPGPQDTALLQYTSGSTGDPKGVILSHANLLANIRVMGQAIQAGPGDVFVSWLPLYHDMGLIGAWLGSLYYGTLLVIMPPLSFIARPQRWLWAIHRYRATLSAAPNFAYELCLRRIDERDLQGLDLGSWRAAFNGAEPVSAATVERFCERFAPYGFRREALMPVYGLAENAVGLAFPPLGRGPLIDRVQREAFTRSGRALPAPGSDTHALDFVASGRPLPGHGIRIVDPAGRELPERREGRLQFRGPSATCGYFRNPQQTRALFQGEWLDSGDRAYITEGDVYVTGRAKDIIIRAGRNIYPEELEEAVGDLPGARKGCVAVFGSPAPDTGTERLIVLAETRLRDRAALDSLRSRIDVLATDLTGIPPDDVALAPPRTVPKTSSGKIRRAAARDLYERGRIGRPPRSVRWQLARLALNGLVPLLRRLHRATGASLYAAYAWALFGVLLAPVWLLVVLLPRFSWRWSAMAFGTRLLARASGTPLAVHGAEHLPPGGRPCVLVANHASYLDGYALAAALPRPFSFVAKAELFQRFSIRVPARRLQVEFVERFEKEQGVADARRLARAAQAGHSLMFFAEGTFTRAPGLLPFRMGAFVTAAEADIPVVPIAIRGTRSLLRGDSWFPRRGAVFITIGKPIDPADFKDGPETDTWTVALGLRDAARNHILRHCGEPDLADRLHVPGDEGP